MYSALNFGDDKTIDISVAPVYGDQPEFSITPLLILGGILLILNKL